ncbi:MAG: hypothetical protein SVV03_06010 [Candidatus Nanohaloarchaea archaeon]|nr:hypothetical protein [Candidatus Nanohaloarchaea archaeon]
MENLEIDTAVRGDYSSVDLYLVPEAVNYADMVEKVLDKFGEDNLELVIDESSMPLPYYDALEIPLEVFEEKYDIQDEENISREKALNLCRDLLSFGVFDLGFRGDNISVFISHDGYVNVKPLNLDEEEFQEKIESIGDVDE